MKTTLLLILSVFIAQCALAQPIKEPIYPNPPDDTAIPLPPQVDTIYAYAEVDTPPLFPGGEDSLKSYIYKNLRYPEIAKENDIQGTVYVAFIIDKTGAVIKPTVKKGLKGAGKSCDNEAIRLIKNMPKWSPGKQNGKQISTQYNLPICFTLR
jgi:protein TonB